MVKKPDPFSSPKRRLARAKKHIRRLEKRIHTFVKMKPWKRCTETDAQGVTTHALKFTREIPDSWGDAAVEALDALRSTLDQSGYAAAVLSGITEPKCAYFPVADTVADLDRVVKGRCKDLPPEISALFRSFNAYQGGNYALWALNKLCNANKHRLLIPVCLQSGGMVLNVGIVVRPPVELLGPRWDRDRNHIAFARVGPGGEFKYDAEFSFSVFFDDFNGVNRGPAVGILDAIASEVESVLMATKAECRRIGLVH